MTMTIRNLGLAFNPSSIALIGASTRETSVGFTVWRNLREGGFAGPVWPVNPKYADIGGAPCFADVAALPQAPDLAVIVTPARTVPGLISELAAKGTRAAIVLSAGIDETSGLRQAMLDAARPTCFRIIGPNCLGLFLPHIGLNASFAHLAPAKGRLALLSQSGAFALAILDWAAARAIGFSHVVSMGDMADVDVGDLLDFLAGDATSHAILMYLETVPDPRKFLSAARSAARVKPVVVIKAGRSAAAAKAAATHTGALAGNDHVADAAFRRAGLLRVGDLEALFDAAETLTRLNGFTGDRLAIVTNGGGAGVLAVDSLMDFGGTLAALSPETVNRLDAALPPTWSKANPIDIIGDAGAVRYRAAVEAVLDDPQADALLVMNCPTALASSADAARAVIEVVAQRRARRLPLKPVLTNWLGEATAQTARALFAQANIATYDSPGDAVRSFAYRRNHAKALDALMRTPPSLPKDFTVDAGAARRAMAEAEAGKRGLLTEPEAKHVLAAYGIPVARTEIARDPAEVGTIAAALLRTTDAVAVKVLSEEISHKSDVGGVALDLISAQDARRAAEEIAEKVARARPDARIQGFTVQDMIRRLRAHELIAGVADDPIFGPTMLFGAGGTAVEVIRDTAVALPPLDLKLARDLIDETRIAKLLAGYRDRAPADIEAIAMTLVRLCQLITDFPVITEIDINPLLADDEGVIALDARIKADWSKTGLAAPNPRFAIRPYPNNWEKEVVTANGQRLLLKPIQPTDEGQYRAFTAAITAEDWRLRFFAPSKNMSQNAIARFTQIDYARAMAFIALRPETGEILGVSRLVADPDYMGGEYAVLVRSDLKGQGIGWALMQHLIAYAKAEGLALLRGEVLSENTQMLGMCRQLGFAVKTDPDDYSLCHVTLPLGPDGPAA
jgi:acetyltransferase